MMIVALRLKPARTFLIHIGSDISAFGVFASLFIKSARRKKHIYESSIHKINHFLLFLVVYEHRHIHHTRVQYDYHTPVRAVSKHQSELDEEKRTAKKTTSETEEK